jgi:hypothetical protein
VTLPEPLDLEAITTRVDAATKGPWTVRAADTGIRSSTPYAWVLGPGGAPVAERHNGGTLADTEFIAHARTDVPALLAEVSRLRTELADAQMAAAAEADLVDEKTAELAALRTELAIAQELAENRRAAAKAYATTVDILSRDIARLEGRVRAEQDQRTEQVAALRAQVAEHAALVAAVRQWRDSLPFAEAHTLGQRLAAIVTALEALSSSVLADPSAEYKRLTAERTRLIAAGADPASLAMPRYPVAAVDALPSTPRLRTFAMPEVPDDVTALVDSRGRVWWPAKGDRDLWWYEGYQGSWTLHELMARRGPLTESAAAAPGEETER